MNQLSIWQAKSLVGLIVFTMPIIPANARTLPTPQPVPEPKYSACQAAESLATSHPDVQLLKGLVAKYKIELPLSFSLDNSSITRHEITQILELFDSVTEMGAGDKQILNRLQSRYVNIALDREHHSYQPYRSKGRVRHQPTGGAAGEILNIAPPMQPLAKPAPAYSQSAPPPVSPSPVDRRIQIAPPPLAEQEIGDEPWRKPRQPGNTEDYKPIEENPFLRPSSNPLSTFAIDVDTGAYSNVRRFISQGSVPPKDAVRLEELINYFPYQYSQPQGDQPFSVNTAVTQSPWNPKHKLVQIGLQGKQLETPPPSNLVFLFDVSGSMSDANKLPLLKQSFCMLVDQLSPQDKVSIVVYAGSAGTVLAPTAGSEKAKIKAAIDRLEAGGSTAGAQGIELAYQEAQKNLIKDGNNRVILATDGDFNVGVASDAELIRMIEKKRDQGIFLSILGFGMGNLKDGKMEQLANKGNGTYAYIDTLPEARKVLVNDLRGTLFTIAKDVKIQVEFNPAHVQAYRLIGYENRTLRDQDFNDDTKDAGEIGAGHRVTALYEVVPTGIPLDVKIPSIDGLKYQKANAGEGGRNSNELMQVKLRYKAPNSNESKLISQSIANEVQPADNELKFAASVALFGMVIRDSAYKQQGSLKTVLQLAEAGKGEDREGYRGEFIRMVKRYQKITTK